MRIQIIIFILLSSLKMLNAQTNLERGFQMLENGQFAEAEIFFSDVLKAFPENKTAQLCYGRALGLNTSPIDAVKHFSWMEEQYPGDNEIRVNKAEALLWSNQSGKALKLFHELYNTDSTNFAIVLGYANTLSIEKNYESALEMINRALDIEDNPQALNSKKYILLGLSSLARNMEDYTLAHSYLDTIESTAINDRDVLLTRGSLYLNQQKIPQAHNIYRIMLDEQIDFSEAALGYSYTSMLLKDMPRSIEWAQKVLESARINQDTLLMRRSSISLINTLGADKKFRQAFETLNYWEDYIGSHIDFQLSRIRLFFWSGNFSKARNMYQELLKADPDNYEIKLSIAELLFADQKHKEAIEHLNEILLIYPEKKGARRLKDKILLDQSPSIDINVIQMEDNGGNQSREYNGIFQFKKNGLISPFIQFNTKRTQQNLEAISALRTTLTSGFNYIPNARFQLRTSFGMQRSSSFLSEDQNSFLMGLNIRFKPLINHNVGLSVESNSLAYNSEMIRSNTRLWRFSGNYFTTIANHWGVYLQAGVSYLSDQNTNRWTFLSFYHQFTQLKGLKGGINASYLGFKQTDKNLYFSPGKFVTAEVFVNYQKSLTHNDKLSIMAECGFGVQGNGEDAWQNSFRWKTAFSYRLNQNLEMRANIMGSNSAAENASGYAYHSINLSLRMVLGNDLVP